MSTTIAQDQVRMAQDALSTFYNHESPGFAMAGAAHAILATLDAPRRVVVQYDFRDDETWAYCNDGTVFALRRGPGGVKEWQQQVHRTIPQPE